MEFAAQVTLKKYKQRGVIYGQRKSRDGSRIELHFLDFNDIHKSVETGMIGILEGSGSNLYC